MGSQSIFLVSTIINGNGHPGFLLSLRQFDPEQHQKFFKITLAYEFRSNFGPSYQIVVVVAD
jgi:hypothetical protein